MKKHLIAAAVAAAVAVPAFAQSSVEIYGVIDRAYSTYERTDTVKASGATTTTKGSTTGGSGASGASGAAPYNFTTERLGFRGTEDLGGGLKAQFVIEYRINDNDAADGAAAAAERGQGTDDSPLSQRQAWAGISGGFGAVSVGRQTTAVDTVWGVGSAGFQNNFFGTLYKSQRQTAARADRLISYTSPTMNGLNATVQLGKKSEKTQAANSETANEYTGLALRYVQGPLSVALGYENNENKASSATTDDLKATVLGANYNFGPAIGFFTYLDSKNSGSTTVQGTRLNDRKAYEIGVRIPVGAITLIASAYTGDIKVTSSATKQDIDGHQVAALYALSKRTTLYAAYGKDNFDAIPGTSAVAGVTTSKREFDVLGAGIRHTF